MNFRILLAAAILFCYPASAQKHIPKNGLQSEKLKGAIRLIIYTKYEKEEDSDEFTFAYLDSSYYNRAGNLVKEAGSYPDVSSNNKKINTYDSSGIYLLHSVSLNNDGIMDSEQIKEYNENGYETKMVLNYYSEGDKNTTIDSYLYDTHNNLVEVRSTNLFNNTVQDPEYLESEYTYKMNKDPLTEKHYNEKGELTYSVSMIYDDSGKLEKQMDLLKNRYVLFTYDNSGRKVMEKIFAHTGSLLERSVYTYDSHDNINRQIMFKDEKQVSSSGLDFENYDTAGNWQKITFIENDAIKGYGEVKIFYY